MKVLNSMANNSPASATFDQLAASLIKLNHPNLVRYLDAFKIAPDENHVTPILVMELIEGVTLAKKISKNRKGIAGADMAGILKQMVDGMSYADEAGVLPRYFKKSNVLFDANDTLKIVGFGSPYVGTSGGASIVGEEGFYDYLPPEYVSSDQFGDSAASIFSLAVCCFEASTGKLPFPKIKDAVERGGDNFNCFASAYLSRWGNGSEQQVEYKAPIFKESPELKAWFEICLQKDRGSRYQDFTSVRGSLVDVINKLNPALVDDAMRAAASQVVKPSPSAGTKSGKSKKGGGGPKIKTPDLSKAGPVTKKQTGIKTPDLSKSGPVTKKQKQIKTPDLSKSGPVTKKQASATPKPDPTDVGLLSDFDVSEEDKAAAAAAMQDILGTPATKSAPPKKEAPPPAGDDMPT
ncbi:MAG: protein kinase, partial [Verrucomicrobiota bacterium]